MVKLRGWSLKDDRKTMTIYRKMSCRSVNFICKKIHKKAKKRFYFYTFLLPQTKEKKKGFIYFLWLSYGTPIDKVRFG